MKYKIPMYIRFIVVLLVLLVGCSSKNTTEIVNDREQETVSEQADLPKESVSGEANKVKKDFFDAKVDLSKSFNYLFFDDDAKVVTLPISTNIDDIIQAQVKCYQNEEFITDQICILGYDENNRILSLSINKFVHSFNKIEISKGNFNKIMDVGQFYFEKPIRNTLDRDKRLSLVQYKTRDLINAFEGEFEVSGKVGLANISNKFPEKLEHDLNLNTNLKANGNTIKFSCSYTNDDFKASGIEYLSFDVLLLQFKDDECYRIISCNVPLEPK